MHRLTDVGFHRIWRHTFKIAAMTSFHAEKCCHLVNAHTASAWRIYSSARHCLIHIVHSYIFVFRAGDVMMPANNYSKSTDALRVCVTILKACARVLSAHVLITNSKLISKFCISGGDLVGVLGSWPPPSLTDSRGSKCARPHFLVPCCYTWAVIHSMVSVLPTACTVLNNSRVSCSDIQY